MKKRKIVILLAAVLALLLQTSVYAAKLPWPTETSNKYKGGFSLYKGHNGMDIKAKSGSVLYSPVDGTAKYYQRYRSINGKKVLVSYGNYVEITSKDKKTKVCICHMSKFANVKFAVSNAINAKDYWKKHDGTLSQASWKSSDKQVLCGAVSVKVGDIVGYSGGTGRSTGPHLHVTLYVKGNFKKAVDPYKYFDAKTCARNKGSSKGSSKVSFTAASQTIWKNQSKTLSVKISGSQYKKSNVRFSSAKPSSVSVNAKTGAIKGLRATSSPVKITAYFVNSSGKKVSGSETTCSVTVKNPTIKVTASKKTIEFGKTMSLKATVSGPSASVKWKSDNTLVTVNSKGQLSVNQKVYKKVGGRKIQIRAGSATISATANGTTAKIKITVVDPREEAKKAYRKFVSSSTTFECKNESRVFKTTVFAVYDLDGDGVLELIAGDGEHSHSWEPLQDHYHILLFKYSDGQVKLVGGYTTKKNLLDEVRVNTKKKAVALHTYYDQWEWLDVSGKYLDPVAGSYKTIPLLKNNSVSHIKYLY